MRLSKRHLSVIVLMLSLCSICGCRSGDSANSGGVKDANALVSETLAHFNLNSLACIAKISKVYKNNRRFDDELRIYIRINGLARHMVLQVKPRPDNAGVGFLAEQQDKQITSIHRYIPETDRVTAVDIRQASSDVVIGGLSMQEFQMFQGTSPFEEMNVIGETEINGTRCYEIEATLADKSRYSKARFFTSVKERLPVLMRTFNKEGVLAKEIYVDKVEPVGNTWVVTQLTVKEERFNYISTFSFEDIQVDAPIADSVFTVDYLKKGWQG